MRVILLIIIGFSVLNAEITRESNGIVTDTNTKLQWQDDAVSSAMAWEAAINHCESLPLGEHNDWRLPNINELKSIVNKSKAHPAIVDGFVNTWYGHHWSSTTTEFRKGNAWVVIFYYGSISSNDKYINCCVRCVRDGQ